MTFVWSLFPWKGWGGGVNIGLYWRGDGVCCICKINKIGDVRNYGNYTFISL